MTERRILAPEGGVEIEERDGGQPPVIRGYAAIFNSFSEDLGGFREIIRPGAFTQSIANGDDVVARWEHDAVLGRTSNGTLKLVEDSRGLRYEVTPNMDTTDGRDAVAKIKRRDVFQSSFAFQVRSPNGDLWRKENGQNIRELHSVVLRDVSPVSSPAYAHTEVDVRGLTQLTEDEQRESQEAADSAAAEAQRELDAKLSQYSATAAAVTVMEDE